MTPTQIVWQAAGCPPPRSGEWEDRAEVCLVCGTMSIRCQPDRDAIPRTDTDRDAFAAQWSEWVCAGCAWTSSGRPPDTLRLWTVVYREDGGLDHLPAFDDYMDEKGEGRSIYALRGHADTLCLTNKADLRPVTRLLCDPPECPWFVAVAESGQIHTLRFARINRGDRWLVRHERADVAGSSDCYALVTHNACSLLLAGFRADEILTGTPSTHSLKRAGIEAWRRHSDPLQPYFRSQMLELALFCCQKKDHRHDHLEIARTTNAGEPGSRPAARLAAGSADRPADPHVGLERESAEGRGRPECIVPDVRERGETPAPDQPRTDAPRRQLSLFD